jgi:hypothetical protein
MAFAVVGLVIIGLIMTGCSRPWQSTPTPEPHQSFSYGTFSSVDPSKDFHPGDEITFTWEPRPERTVHAKNPDDVTLRAALFGPFDSVDHLKEQMSSMRSPGQKLESFLNTATVRIDPITTDSWTSRTYTSTMHLPSRLQPGYYSFLRASTTTSSNGYSESSGQTVLHVVAP